MIQNGWDDTNIPDNAAFISICCHPIIKEMSKQFENET